jgi:hypothetical protein
LLEIGLTYKVSIPLLARRHGVSKDALYRHSRAHLSPQVKAATLAGARPTAVDLEELQASEAEGLLGQLVAQRARLQAQGELAIELGDVRTAIHTEGAITANLTLVAKLLGQLTVRHEVKHTNLLISADYLQLRQTIVRALVPFPEAAGRWAPPCMTWRRVPRPTSARPRGHRVPSFWSMRKRSNDGRRHSPCDGPGGARPGRGHHL